MRKIYSLVLLATALLIGTNAWAQVQGVIKNVQTGDEYEHLKDAFAAARDGDVLELTGNMNENETKAAWLGAPSSGTLENYASPDSENPQNGYRSITLDLKGHMYYNSGARYVIALTRGKLRITSTGGEGEIKLKKHGIAVYGTYLKIDAKTQTPFSYLIIDKNVKITEGEKGVVLADLHPYEASSNWQWDTYPVDYNCAIFPNANWGIANGARIDIHGKLETTEYACQVSGNVRSALEFLNLDDGSYVTQLLYGNQIHFPLYWQKAENELYLPGTTMEGKTQETRVGAWTSAKAYYGSNDYVLTLNDNNYAPYVHIYSTAKLTTNNPNEKSAVGFYSAGYSRVYIEGTCEGSTGLYVKSGDVELHNATITSNYSGDYAAAVATNSGVVAGGSGIVIESNRGYTGNIDATVSGDTYVEGSTGYAIDEAVTNAEGTEVDAITITGGTFVGGGQGTLKLDETTVTAAEDPNDQTTISITGGAVANGQTTIQVGDDEIPLTDFLADTQNTNTHITYVTDENNKTTMVISEGPAPETYEDLDDPTAPTPWAWCAHNDQSGKNVAWTKIEDAEIASGTVRLGELQINSGSSLEGNQQLTIHDGATLQVNHLIMNNYARIIVEAGGSLIIKGKQGIVAPKVENIVLKASESAQALFLFHPEVESNSHPNATVEFISNSITDGDVYTKQRFGIPTYEKLENITTKYNNEDVRTVLSKFIYGDNEWVDFGWINFTTKTPNLDQMASPFDYYQMQNNAPHNGTVVTMYGKLYGNSSPALEIRENSWNGYANSYMAPINAQALIDLIPGSADKSFHIYTPNDDERKKGSWAPVSNLDLEDIKPMQAFLLSNPNDAAAVTVDYWDAVYGPITGEYKPNQAPARRSALSNITKAKMIVRGEDGMDRVVLAQGHQFSAAFDNSYDCRKYMNEGINLYVSADEKMGIFATDNLENTYVGFQSVNGGTYTIEFTDVQGEGLTLIDHETGAQVAIVNGNVYEFTANGTNDYRFEIITAPMMPTAIENAEAVKSAKGIYTITGQFMGEMSVWNSLPAGVYVVNGEKRVK